MYCMCVFYIVVCYFCLSAALLPVLFRTVTSFSFLLLSLWGRLKHFGRSYDVMKHVITCHYLAATADLLNSCSSATTEWKFYAWQNPPLWVHRHWWLITNTNMTLCLLLNLKSTRLLTGSAGLNIKPKGKCCTLVEYLSLLWNGGFA